MSFSVCIKCKNPVFMYDKYCESCLETYQLEQDPTFHKEHPYNQNWGQMCEEEFEKDLAAGRSKTHELSAEAKTVIEHMTAQANKQMKEKN